MRVPRGVAAATLAVGLGIAALTQSASNSGASSAASSTVYPEGFIGPTQPPGWVPASCSYSDDDEFNQYEDPEKYDEAYWRRRADDLEKAGFGLTAPMLRHYLTGDGSGREIDMDRLIYDNDLRQPIIDAAIAILTERRDAYFQQQLQGPPPIAPDGDPLQRAFPRPLEMGPVSFDLDKTQIPRSRADYDMSRGDLVGNPFHLFSPEADWWAMLGKFDAYYTAHVEAVSDTSESSGVRWLLKITYDMTMIDLYDFDRNDSTFGSLAVLEEKGCANSFYISGKVAGRTVTVAPTLTPVPSAPFSWRLNQPQPSTTTSPSVPPRTSTTTSPPPPITSTTSPPKPPNTTTTSPPDTSTTSPPPPATQPRFTPEQACGADFHVVDQEKIGDAGVVYLLWHQGSKKNCVVTMKTRDIGKPTYANAFLQPQGEKGADNPGKWKDYAGPVIKVASGCVRWGGSVGKQKFDSATQPHRDHCDS